MKRTNIYLGNEQYFWLKQYGEQRGLSTSGVIRKAIDEWIVEEKKRQRIEDSTKPPVIGIDESGNSELGIERRIFDRLGRIEQMISELKERDERP